MEIKNRKMRNGQLKEIFERNVKVMKSEKDLRFYTFVENCEFCG